jgi:DNA integrity scanning protein DisA with diadenylate cyclase activity
MWEILHGFRPRDAIDILLVSYVFYRVFLMFRGTLAVQMLMGLAFLMGASFASKKLMVNKQCGAECAASVSRCRLDPDVLKRTLSENLAIPDTV